MKKILVLTFALLASPPVWAQTTNLIAPQLAVGCQPEGVCWETEVMVIRTVADEPLFVREEVYSRSGSQMGVVLQDLKNGYPPHPVVWFEAPFPPEEGSHYHHALSSEQEVRTGWINFEYRGPRPLVSTRYTLYQAGKVVTSVLVTVEKPAEEWQMPIVSILGQQDLGVALVNPGTMSADVVLEIKTGLETHSVSLVLSPSEQESFMIRDLFEGLPGQVSGLLSVRSSVSVGATAIQVDLNGSSGPTLSGVPVEAVSRISGSSSTP